MKKGTELIDEKLSELYAQLETLGSIREKTATIKEVTANLASIGDERVKQVASVLADFSRKTNDVVGDVEACIDKLNKVLVDIKFLCVSTCATKYKFSHIFLQFINLLYLQIHFRSATGFYYTYP